MPFAFINVPSLLQQINIRDFYVKVYSLPGDNISPQEVGYSLRGLKRQDQNACSHLAGAGEAKPKVLEELSSF